VKNAPIAGDEVRANRRPPAASKFKLSIRNQLLYPEAWDLLREENGGDRCTDAGRAISTEAYVWQGRIYTERPCQLGNGRGRAAYRQARYSRDAGTGRQSPRDCR
jgi:hypothetical protein